MINRTIGSQIKMASDIATEFFPNIHCDIYRHDYSWLTTMRALLPSRIPDGKVSLSHVSRDTPSKRSRADRFEYYMHGIDITSPNTITFVNINKTTEDLDKVISSIKYIGIEGHVLHEKIYDMFKAAGGDHPTTVAIFTNDEIANSVVFVNPLAIMVYHRLIGFMRSVFFKKAFEAVPATEKEMELLYIFARSSEKDEIEAFEAWMEDHAQQYDFQAALVRKSLSGFTKRANEMRMKTVQRSISEKNNSIERHRREIASLLAQRNKLNVELFGLQVATEKDKSSDELMEFFLGNKAVIFTGSTDDRIDYWVDTELSYWDDDEAKAYIASKSGNMYAGCENNGINKDKYQKLLTAMFIDRTVKVRMSAAYNFRFNSDRVEITIDSSATKPIALRDNLNNPHSMHYNCWGSHISNVIEALECCDYASAVAATIAFTGDLTISDASCEYFHLWLTSSREKCLVMSDGRRLTCKEYISELQ